jgi:hypothetical protein
VDVMMEEDRFIDNVRDIDPPPATPREEMWARIQQQRAATRPEPVGPIVPVIELKPRTRNYAWVQWTAALAAMLVVGIGIGRLTVLRQTEVTQQAPVATAPAGDATSPYRLAATQHLLRAEDLLNALVIEANSRPVGEMQTWARELRTETRMLLGSPAAEEPVMRGLLEDIELLLSQIAAIPSDRVNEEVQLIQEGINEGGVLLRVRAATATRPVVGT